jgi:predicted secreted protein with PEFG-CTERM motif
MNAHTSYALIAILAVVGTISIMPAFAELPPACPDCVGDSRSQAMMAAQKDIPVTVWTDSAIYDHESMIMVEGIVANTKMGVPVTLTVISPSNNIVTIQQLDVDNNGEFASTLNTAGSLWKYDGNYTIRVQYGSQEVNIKVLVQITGGITSAPTTPSVSCGTSEVAATDQCIPFSITGGMVTGADINDNDNSIIVRISADEDGEITLNPSTKTIGGIFMVLVDGEEWDDVTIDGNEVTIMFPAGAEEIEIIGTFVIPEFGTIAVMILAVAIVSIIAVTSRSRLSVMPKF